MPKVDPAKQEERRRQILEAAGRCFLSKGLSGAAVSDICDEAGISPGHLYYYFDSRDSLVSAFIEMKLEETDRMISEQVGQCGPIEAVIRNLEWLKRPEEFALECEILAQAARSPKIANILRTHSNWRFKAPHQ